MTASFRMNQGTTGTYGLARQDLTVGAVTLEAENILHSTYDWVITSEPEGSTSDIVGSGPTVTLNLTITGGFLIRLTVDEGLATEDVMELYAGIPLSISGLCIPAFNETIQDNSESFSSKYGYERKLTRFLKWVDTSLVSSGNYWSRVTGSPNYVYPTVAYDEVRIGDLSGDTRLSFSSVDAGSPLDHYSSIVARSKALLISSGNYQAVSPMTVEPICYITHDSSTTALIDFSPFTGGQAAVINEPSTGIANLSVITKADDSVSNSQLQLSSFSGSNAISNLHAEALDDGATTTIGLLTTGHGTSVINITSQVLAGSGNYSSNISIIAQNLADPGTANSTLLLDSISSNGTALINLGSNTVDEIRNEIVNSGFFSWYVNSTEYLRLNNDSGTITLATQNLDGVTYNFNILHHQENGATPSIMKVETSSSITSVGSELYLYATTGVDNYADIDIKAEGQLPTVTVRAVGIASGGSGSVNIEANVPNNDAIINIDAISTTEEATINITTTSDPKLSSINIQAISTSYDCWVMLSAHAGAGQDGGVIIGDYETSVVQFDDYFCYNSTFGAYNGPLCLSTSIAEWEEFYTKFGFTTLINALNQVGKWVRSGIILSPATSGDIVRIGAGSATSVGIGFEGTNNTGFYQKAATEIGLAINGNTDSFFGRSEIGGTYGDRPALMGEEPIGIVSYSDQSVNIGAGDLYLAAVRDTTDAGDAIMVLNTHNYNSTTTNGGSILTIKSHASEDYATLDLFSRIEGVTESNILASTNVHAYNDSTGQYTDAVVALYAEATNAGIGLVLIGNDITDVVGFSDVNLDTASLSWSTPYLALSDAAADWTNWDSIFSDSLSLISGITAAMNELLYSPYASSPLTSSSGVLTINATVGNIFRVNVTESITSILFNYMTVGFGNTYYGRRIKIRFNFTTSATISISGISGGVFESGATDISGTNGDIYILHVDDLGSSKRYCRIKGPYPY